MHKKVIMSILKTYFFFIMVSCLYNCNTKPESENKESVENKISEVVKVANVNYPLIINKIDDLSRVPQTVANGELILSGVREWTSGFFAGSLWYLYELTGEEKWKVDAIRFTEALDTVQYYTGDHDVGFMINCSFGNALRITRDKKYEKQMVNASKALSTRFSPVVKSFSSWPTFKPFDEETVYDYAVIVDNMMNLELLYEGSKISKDDTFKELANVHAYTTIKNHFRPDYSSYHVVCYDKNSGDVISKKTAQGFADNSSWARGQSWGLYGFVMSYRETKNLDFLKQAENIADYIVDNPFIPADKVPKWDYHVNEPGYNPPFQYTAGSFVDQRDASSAAIAASALLELSTLDVKNKEKYRTFAETALNTLSSKDYLAIDDSENYFLLKHSVGSVPASTRNSKWGQIDQPLCYADYYYLEALLRLREIEKKS